MLMMSFSGRDHERTLPLRSEPEPEKVVARASAEGTIRPWLQPVDAAHDTFSIDLGGVERNDRRPPFTAGGIR